MLYITNHLDVISHFQICIDEFSLYQVLSQLTVKKIAFTPKGVFEIMPISIKRFYYIDLYLRITIKKHI